MIEKNVMDLSIIVIEDQDDARAMIKAMLKSLGVAKVYEAKNGVEGLSFLDIAPDMIDGVICDLMMPEMSGIDLLLQIRAVDPYIPFIMITGSEDATMHRKAKQAGTTAFIKKPFSLEQLQAKLEVIYDSSLMNRSIAGF